VADATGYDVVKGSLTALRLYENFISGTSGCVGNDLPATTAQDAEVPSPNDGVWYLVRAVNSCAPGGFDDGSPAQVGGRDDSIAASGVACP
jgi:hypothetical protein